MKEPLVLVGFGKYDLIDLWAKKDTEEGAQILKEAIPTKHYPPRYRRLSICTQEEVKVFQEYLKWILSSMSPTREEKNANNNIA